MFVICKSHLCSSYLILGSLLLALELTEAGWWFSSKNKLHPVVLIPGFGGSQIRAKIDKKIDSPRSYCAKENTEYTIWLNVASAFKLLRFAENNVGECWVDNMRLVYNDTSRTTSSVQGVTLSVPGFGDTATVEALYPDDFFTRLIMDAVRGSIIAVSVICNFLGLDRITLKAEQRLAIIYSYEYFRDISSALQGIGLKRNISLRAAPYDFRKAPNENEDYFVKLKELVEETYYKNSNSSVVLLAHSMGGPMTLYFLRQQKQEWKDKYIKSLVSLSASWGGTVKAIKAYTEGDVFGSSMISAKNLHLVLKTMPSLAWMLPYRQLWGKDEVLVSTSKRKYTINDIKEFFDDIDQPTAWEMYKDISNYTTDLGPPGVEVHCLFGTTINSTLEQLRYDGSFVKNNPVYVTGDGDGTVNLRSLEVCTHWDKVQTKKLAHVDHMAILRDEKVIEYIESVVRDSK